MHVGIMPHKVWKNVRTKTNLNRGATSIQLTCCTARGRIPRIDTTDANFTRSSLERDIGSIRRVGELFLSCEKLQRNNNRVCRIPGIKSSLCANSSLTHRENQIQSLSCPIEPSGDPMLWSTYHLPPASTFAHRHSQSGTGHTSCPANHSSACAP